jgi:HD superfamily phosphohydrolase YqeK
MDPNDLIDTIVDAIDYAEIARDNQGLIKARRLLNNDLRQAIDDYIQVEVEKVLHLSQSEDLNPEETPF